MNVPVPSREELLAANLTVEVVGTSVVTDRSGRTHKLGTVIRRHRTKEEAMNFGVAERALLDASLSTWRDP